MVYSISKGFASLNYDDFTARMTYIEQLPMIAECLSFQHFLNEFEIVQKSVSQFPELVRKLIAVYPQILQFLNNEQKYQFIYTTGKNLAFSSSDKIEKEFLDFIEKILQELNDYTYEFEKYIQPLLSQKEEFYMVEKFPLWRLARLTTLNKDYSQYENLIFQMFSGNETIFSAAAEELYLMNDKFVNQNIIKVLLSPRETDRMAGIKAIEVHELDTNNESIKAVFKNEKNSQVLLRIVQLPPKLITKDVLEFLIQEEITSKIASGICLSSPFFEDLLPILKSKKGVGCEINNADFSIISKCNPVPYDFLSMLIRESKEIILDKTIESILTLDKSEVMLNLILPRINEKGNWRSRYNSIMIATKLLENSQSGIDPLDQAFVQNFAGFTVAMSLDNVFAVREAAFKTLCFYPEQNALSIIESLTSIGSSNTDDFHKQILREFFTTARPAIVKYGKRDILEDIMKKIDFNDPSFF